MTRFSNNRRLISLALVWLALSGLSPLGLALQSDRKAQLIIESTTAERDEAKGTTTYAGAVVMQQGSMKINDDKIVVYNAKDKTTNKNRVTHIIATGSPARYEQKPSETEAVVVAQASTLEYQVMDESLHLIDSAFLEQEGTSLSGSRIDYDVRNSVVKAGGQTTSRERVRMVITPNMLGSDDDSPQAGSEP